MDTKRYKLMHKNVSVVELSFDITNGKLESVDTIIDKSMLPLASQSNPELLKSWWFNRAVSKNQSSIKEMLSRNGVSTTQSFLLNNLGLSMIDAYWVKPIESKIEWEEVSFHLNPFSGDALDFFFC